MSYYRTCPSCGAHLDPGERCDCREDEKALVSATNTDKGEVEQGLTDTASASYDPRNGGNLQV